MNTLSTHRSSREAPWEYRDAVELWARQHGGHGDLVWFDAPINAWAVRLSLKPGDPRLRHPDEGTHLEQVLLHEWVDPRKTPDHPLRSRLRRGAKNELRPGFVHHELDELGIEKIIETLDKGSLLTGRGEFKNGQDAFQKLQERNRALQDSVRKAAEDAALSRMQHYRHAIEGTPRTTVGIDLNSRREGATP